MDTLLDDITTLDFNIIGRHYHRRDGIVTRHNNKNCKWINHPITPCDYNNVLADITETEEIMTDIQFSECLICGWTFIDNVGPKSCIMCGATKDEEYIDYDKMAKDNKSDVDYENGQRDY